MDEYNWNLIIKIAGPVSAVLFIVLYFNWLSFFPKWAIIVAGMAVTYALISQQSKKKADIFTAMLVVALAGVLFQFIQRAGFI